MKAPIVLSLGRRIVQAAACTLIGAFYSEGVLALEVTPVKESGQLGIEIAHAEFPESLTKDLVSGLTNKLLVRVVLNADAAPVAQRAVEIAVKYDLWDEKFLWTLKVDDVATASGSYDNSRDVILFLATIRVPKLFAVDSLGRKPLTIRVDMLLNPIDRERMEKIRKWVADNSAFVPAEIGGTGGGRAVSSRANPLFNKIFEEYSNGADLSATWKISATSRAFTFDAVEERGNAR